MQRLEGDLFEAEQMLECDSLCFLIGENPFRQIATLFSFLQMWKQKEVADRKAEKYVSETYPQQGHLPWADASKRIDQLFNASMPVLLKVRWKDLDCQGKPVSEEKMDPWLSNFPY